MMMVRLILEQPQKNDGYGDYYDDVVYVKYEPAKGSEKLLEDDKVDVYGECRGDISYESTFGQKITIPALYAKYIIRRQDKGAADAEPLK